MLPDTLVIAFGIVVLMGIVKLLNLVLTLGDPGSRSAPPSSTPDRVVTLLRRQASLKSQVRSFAPPLLAAIGEAYVRAGVEVLSSAELVRALRGADPCLTVVEAFDALRALQEADALLLISSPADGVRPEDRPLCPPGEDGALLATARTLIPLDELARAAESRGPAVVARSSHWRLTSPEAARKVNAIEHTGALAPVDGAEA